ncbi:MAG: family 16 glycoside hydrolase, partial [Bacteroidales bacterium]
MRKTAWFIFSILFAFAIKGLSAQEKVSTFGQELQYNQLISEKASEGKEVNWFQVNTEPDTWKLKDEVLICSGDPIGVIRSEKKYENFILHIEWKHMEAGGNSGTFVWSSAVPGDNRLPDGVEVQMLELDWVNQNKR